ncbi:hypothetical protein C8R44DRAFT_883531 [Mycena epipterygia]|nr:hypothetical protein C8R44DRAFT_883531 [Mycena epipterygia]
MSRRINGTPALNVVAGSAFETVFSFGFLSGLYPSGNIPLWVPVALDVIRNGTFTVSVRARVEEQVADVCLGLDWRASLYKYFVCIERITLHVATSFGSAQFYVGKTLFGL